MLYKASGYCSRECERSLRWDDPELAITWPLEALAVGRPDLVAPQLSEKDAVAPLLAEFRDAYPEGAV